MNKDLGTWGMNVDIKGSVANVSPSTLSKYQLIVNYASYNEKGELYLLKDKAELYTSNYFDDGFGGGFAKSTLPWPPKEIKEFKFSDRISIEDSLYPTNHIFVVVSIRGSDPFDSSFYEPIATADITSQWHQVQTALKNKLEVRKKRTGPK